ncbi:MAG: protein TolR [Alphaproteobacteria bacterium]
MAGQLNGVSRRGRRTRYKPMAEINVTPMVDVMLVLLIIFMIAAPLLTVGVPIELPETDAKQLTSEKEPLTISVDSQGRIFLQDNEIPLEEVVPKLTAIAERGFNERIYVRGDRNVGYGQVMRVMGRIANAGFKSIGLVTELEDNQ